ncbi:hypothetical protein HYPSUDRAFT_60597 [Hypholoma sublateritium FD-334 SS-4]|uniref:GPI inositol-deacylase n=1 Tax=Hypholoma sublateritium (strain FD-334 SS-4) TaxID=945553 RepID=A0A0D2QDU2_HYPSF|nr:hypothetical protein HYPSUDRAFT_60597 [Hypholoma sublateritium FD-334 SS-4]
MPTIVTGFLGIFSLLTVLVFYLASLAISTNLSPQGCRMSWMSPSYVQQTNFNANWSPLSGRYSLWLYREVGWDLLQERQRENSLPVLFIPGNAGSSHQVRSIASSATRQYFSSPHVVSETFESRSVKPLDFFAVEFNEDLSAFHSSTLESQIAYSRQAISYILSLYPLDTKILIVGHSMGGVVATSLLPSGNISAIITMSTPHTLPPARFDYRIDKLYHRLQTILRDDPTPIVSICGGATDLMIPSESCVLPKTTHDIFRRTVFTSALEGAWTGVGHREMVWCHQVRWRVARSALELGPASTLSSRAAILDKWLRDGHSPPPSLDQKSDFDPTNVEMLALGQILRLNEPRNPKGYLLPVDADPSVEVPQKITVLVSQGAIASVSPQNAIDLRLSIFSCTGPSAADCLSLKPDTLKLVPNPGSRKVFPVPQEGSDESEGVVFYEALIPRIDAQQWIGVKVDGADGRGWVMAGISQQTQIVSPVSTLALALTSQSVRIPTGSGLTSSFTFPKLISNALVVYRVTTQRYATSSCIDTLFPPLLMHTSHTTETHYFPLTSVNNGRTLLHAHLGAPFIDHNFHLPSYVNLTIISSADPECRRALAEFRITIDWTATLGRWASRYLHTLVSWAAGVASLVVFFGWAKHDTGAAMPTVGQALSIYGRYMLRYLLPASVIFSVIPILEWAFTGNRGVVFFAPIAPLILLTASGLVCVVWWMLSLLLKITGKLNSLVSTRRAEHVGVPKSTVLSLSLICLVIFIFVPWQVAYVGCWLLHLHTCASSAHQLASLGQDTSVEAVPLVIRSGRNVEDTEEVPPSRERPPLDDINTKRDSLNHNLHILVLMTWLLPLTAPVLAVWVRTLLTAGYTTPFDSDHNFLAVLPFLIFADFASWAPARLFEKTQLEKRLPLRWLFAFVAGTAFIFGSRKPYLVLDVARVAMWVIVIGRIGRRYWGGRHWII